MYEAKTCSDCATLVYYPDEVVEGYWFTERDDYNECDVKVFAAVNEDNRGDATHAYCLDCAPCECKEHEKFVAHNVRNIVDWHIKCQPMWID